jgi:hypothetical protein
VTNGRRIREGRRFSRLCSSLRRNEKGRPSDTGDVEVALTIDALLPSASQRMALLAHSELSRIYQVTYD